MSVFVVDDDEQIRKAMTRWLTINGLKGDCYSCAEDFLARVKPALVPACIILDLRMPGMSGLALQQQLNTLVPHWPVIFLTGHGEVHVAVEAVKHGAIDFLEKPIDSHLLTSTVGAALSRSEVLVTLALERAKLTSRECEIVDWLAHGFSSKEIASELDLSVKTVEYHRYNIKAKISLSHYKKALMAAR